MFLVEKKCIWSKEVMGLLTLLEDFPLECFFDGLIIKRDGIWVCESGKCFGCIDVFEDEYGEACFVPGIMPDDSILSKISRLPSRKFDYWDAPKSVENDFSGVREQWVFETVKKLCSKSSHRYYAMHRVKLDLFVLRVFGSSKAIEELEDRFDAAKREEGEVSRAISDEEVI